MLDLKDILIYIYENKIENVTDVIKKINDEISKYNDTENENYYQKIDISKLIL